jgi:hypothetical protein
LREFNYAGFVREFEKGTSVHNMTGIAKMLFKPIFDYPGVVNHFGVKYSGRQAIPWYKQEADIPANIKTAIQDLMLVDKVIEYFNDEVLVNHIDPKKEASMCNEMEHYIEVSNVSADNRRQLKELLASNEEGEFFARAFLLALAGDNRVVDITYAQLPVDEDIRAFKDLIKNKYPRPQMLPVPSTPESHEMKYVSELYRAYHEKTGNVYVRPEDLKDEPRLKRDFDRQRESYYKAETIRRELRDTLQICEEADFETVKDEVFDGVIDTCDRDYPDGYGRMSAVIRHATTISLSPVMNEQTLNWIGPGEQKGICHMLVNDDRLYWCNGDGGEDDE